MKISIVHPRISIFQKNYAFRKSRVWQPISVLTVAAWLEKQGEKRGLVIDPWNELEHWRPTKISGA